MGYNTLRSIFERIPRLSLVQELDKQGLRDLLKRAGVRNVDEISTNIKTQAAHNLDTAYKDLDRFSDQNIELITKRDPRFPERMKELKDCPPWLFVQGQPGLLQRPDFVAVVGTRTPTEPGVRTAIELSTWLSERGFPIVSGLAEGIDAAAHQTSLDFGAPNVAVLGNGIWVVFPASTSHLRRRIVEEGGAVITEFLPNESYQRERFVKRNRLQAALAFAICPVEGAAQSGTSHTLRFAEELHRIIFGVRSKALRDGPMQTLLANRKHPVFDLSSATDLRKLDDLLAPHLQEPAASATGDLPRLFVSTIREFERVVNSYEVSDEQVDKLIATLRQSWEKRQS